MMSIPSTGIPRATTTTTTTNDVSVNYNNYNYKGSRLSKPYTFRVPEEISLKIEALAKEWDRDPSWVLREYVIAALALFDLKRNDPDLMKEYEKCGKVVIVVENVSSSDLAKDLLLKEDFKALEHKKTSIDSMVVKLELEPHNVLTQDLIRENLVKYRKMLTEYTRKGGSPRKDLFEWCDQVAGRLKT